MLSLDSLKFDVSTLTIQGQDSERKAWFTTDGDGIVLYYFAKPPDIQPGLKSIAQLEEMYKQLMRGSPAALVSVSFLTLAECRSIRLIIKSRQQPSGMTYVGSFTIPFRDFSFVIKAQCHEYGTTGIREAILFDRKLKAGSVAIDASGHITGEWDPDNERYDVEFPKHPLTKLRAIMRNVEATCSLDPGVRLHEAFGLPTG